MRYISKTLILVRTLACKMVESDLAHTDALRSNLNELVALDILKTFLKTHYDLRYHTSLLVRATGTHIGELLGLGNVDYEVVVVNMFAHYLTAVNLFTRIDEELATILKLVNRVSIGCTCLHCNHRTVHTAYYLALIRLILLEAVSHNGLALACCEHVGTQTDDTTRRNVELDVNTFAECLH